MKYVFHSPRAAGKTTRMAELVRKTPGAILVCHNAYYADLVRQQHGLSKEQVMSYRQLNKLEGRRDAKLFIDNADIILRNVMGGSYIEGISVRQDCPACDATDE